MPITKSAKKALRVSQTRQVINSRRARQMKSLIKEVQTLASSGKKEEAKALLPRAYKAIDKATKLGVIKKNTAARRKSLVGRMVAAK